MREWLRAALVGVGVVAAALPALAQDKEVQLKISLWIPPAHPLTPATQAWAADIEKASGGSIKSIVFPSEQLGKAFDHYDMARDGIADITYVNPGYQPGRFPVIAVGQLPFMFVNARKGTPALDEWYRAYAAQEMKDTHFCLAFILEPATFHSSKKKVVLPEDLKGMKVRPAQSTVGQMVTMLGGTNVQASAPEARDVLERGVADAITFPWQSLFLFGIDKVVKYHMDLPMFSAVFTYSMNKAKYESLSPKQKQVIDDHCTTQWASRISDPFADFESGGKAKMQAASGHEIYQLTPEQVAAWRKATEPLTQTWADAVRKVGVDPDKAMAEFKASLTKHSAAF